MQPHIEICLNCDDLERLKQNTQASLKGGATRLELCSDMANDGLTPSATAIEIVSECCESATIMVMIRPRAGDFNYSDSDIAVMCQQISMAAHAGADGVVFGVLKNNELAINHLERLVNIAKALSLKTTFHRAFDAIPPDRQISALNTLIEMGVDHLLTSGTPWHSSDGASVGINRLKSFSQVTQQQLELIIGGGVTPDNASQVLTALHSEQVKLALHCYSAVLRQNRVDPALVAMLSQISQQTRDLAL